MIKAGKTFLLSAIIALSLTACSHIPSTDSQNTVATKGSRNETVSPTTEPTVDSTTDSTADSTADALHAYQELLSQKKYRIENKDEDILEETHFAICDLDTNGTPELLISGSSNIIFIRTFYTYENGAITKIEGPHDVDLCPAAGGLYRLPDRNTFAYFRGGPAYNDPDDPENGYMPYTLIEYSIENHQIHIINDAFWEICNFGPKAGTIEYTLNGQKCSAEEIIDQYPLTESKDEDGGIRYYLEESYIELLPNTDDNRQAISAK